MDMYGFYTGQIFDAHKWMGAHFFTDENGNEKVSFRTFAPAADGINLILNDRIIPMNRIYDSNFYEVILDDVKEGDKYEYCIYSRGNNGINHCDPYGFGMELRPAHRSVVRRLGNYTFTDEKWMKKRTDTADKPVNIYELHLGSWIKKSDEETGWYRYDEIADKLVTYLKESGYNYVEFLPLSEHPMDMSWGYQNTGFFAPTSRYGSMDDLKKLIDTLHNNNIGAILDYVPVHFAVDEYALANYDGTALYEYPNNDVGVSEWGSYNFMHSRGEVRSFLQSNANYWLEEYHFDGLRMDAISRIIYWQGDERRGVNNNAVEFIRFMNRELKSRNPGCILIAEDSTNYNGVTKSPDNGGLGFDYKWDMGWMNDTLNYFSNPPENRYGMYHKLTFSMHYYYNEKYLLPLSHDEVVHGKKTIIDKMYGEYEDKFLQVRALFMYMMFHPGKKLNFMGNEIAQFREWDEKREQDWSLREYETHDSFYKYMCVLNNLYLENDAFWQKDYDNPGFEWLDCHSEDKCVYTFKRSSNNKTVIGIFNFSNNVITDYYINLDSLNSGVKPLLSSRYNGSPDTFDESIKESVEYRIENNSMICNIQPYTAVLFN